jgi:Family of unknown function (DUF6283)
MKTKLARTIDVKSAGEDHQVVTVFSEKPNGYRRRPCSTCPWRVDAIGEFPAEAFRHSANTAYDMAVHEFGCHQSGRGKPVTCAGFLLRGARHNLTTRLKLAERKIDPTSVSDAGLELFENYREMAKANGVPPDDPVLAKCRN